MISRLTLAADLLIDIARRRHPDDLTVERACDRLRAAVDVSDWEATAIAHRDALVAALELPWTGGDVRSHLEGCVNVVRELRERAERAEAELARLHELDFDGLCDALDLQAEWDAAQAALNKGLDYEHHSSCGHVWTMRHTACPVCFGELRSELSRLRATLQGIADANWRDWDVELASPEQFVQWAQSRARHALQAEVPRC